MSKLTVVQEIKKVESSFSENINSSSIPQVSVFLNMYIFNHTVF